MKVDFHVLPVLVPKYDPITTTVVATVVQVPCTGVPPRVIKDIRINLFPMAVGGEAPHQPVGGGGFEITINDNIHASLGISKSVMVSLCSDGTLINVNLLYLY